MHILESNLATVTERQIACGVYQPEQFVYSPYMSAYWSGHLIEELLEFVNEESPLKLAEEGADVLIFLQNLTAYLYPKETLIIDLSYYSYPVPFPTLLQAVRANIPDRKSWKQYPPVSFKEWNNKVVKPITIFILDFVNGSDLSNAYKSKMAYNLTREDWS
jgi:hypothetical protein